METNLQEVQYFLARIKEFEKAYGMESWQFQFMYENSRERLAGYSERSAVDYSEWAFLWENFHSHMDQSLSESPPWAVNEKDQQEPEQCSGFCFGGGESDRFRTAISRPRRESSLRQEKRECGSRY